MALISFQGTRVGAVNGANDDGSGGTQLELDTDADLDGNGNPYYAATDNIVIEIDDADIGPNGEFDDSDGEITVLSIKVNGVELLSSPDEIKFGGGGDTYEGDAYFFVEGVKLFFLAPTYAEDFSDATMVGGKLVLEVPDRVSDHDFNENSTIDTGTVEVGNGIFNIQTSNVVCFVTGTLIRTPTGDIPVEEISLGDMVATCDHGAQPVRLIVHRELDFREARPELKPIEFKPGSLGDGLPKRILCVSPQHRMLLSNSVSKKAFGVPSCLVPAKALINLPGVRQRMGCRKAHYYHLIFKKHEVIYSEGAKTESLFPGPMAIQSVSEECRQELLEIFPKLKEGSRNPHTDAVRPIVGAGKAERLLKPEMWRNQSGFKDEGAGRQETAA